MPSAAIPLLIRPRIVSFIVFDRFFIVSLLVIIPLLLRIQYMSGLSPRCTGYFLRAISPRILFRMRTAVSSLLSNGSSSSHSWRNQSHHIGIACKSGSRYFQVVRHDHIQVLFHKLGSGITHIFSVSMENPHKNWSSLL